MKTANSLLTNFIAITSNGRIELAENKETKFKRFWKQIALYGDFVNPLGGAKKMELSKEWAGRIVDNFKNGPIKQVPVPTGHPKTSTELAEHNKGWLIDAEARDDGLWGLIEARDEDTAQKLENGLIADTSVAFDPVYTDKKTGKIFRDVLKHVGLVNDPYIKDMTEFQPALSDSDVAMVLFSDEPAANGNNNKEETTMGVITNDREFPVEVTFTENDEEKKVTVEAGAEVTVPDDQEEAVKKQITDATAPTNDEDEELSDEEKAKAKELSDREAAIAKKEAEFAARDAEAHYEKLLSEGKVVPAQKDAIIALSLQGSATVELSDGSTKTVTTLLSELYEAAPKLNLTDEEGGTGDGKGGDEDVELSSEEQSLTGYGISEDDLKETKKSEGDK